MNITVIGAGSGGLAIAGHLAFRGYNVCLYNRSSKRLERISQTKSITLTGKVNGVGLLALVTQSIRDAVRFADIIMVATIANAHRTLAEEMSPYLRHGQIILLNPGRTGGVYDFRNGLNSSADVNVVEAQTLIYACRGNANGEVNIIGVKDRVLLSGMNADETHNALNLLSSIYDCFIPAQSCWQTGLENIGAILHPPIVIFNAALIDRGEKYYFYRDLSQSISNFILSMDKERLELGKALRIDLHSVEEWVSFAYDGIKGNNFLEKIKNNPAYFNIISPSSISSRQLTEDLPMGLVPMSELGKLLGVATPVIDATIDIGGALLKTDFRKQGRTLNCLGIKESDLCSG